MRFINIRHYSNICFISILCTAFSFVTIAKPQLYAWEIGVNDVVLIAKIKKMVEKLKKIEKSRDKKKIYKAFYEFRKGLEEDLEVVFNVKEALKHIKKSLQYDRNFDEKQFDAAANEIQSCSKDGSYKEDKKVQVKGSLAVGITLALAGLFLYVTKIPALQKPAEWLLEAGGGIILTSMCNKLDEDSSKKKKSLCFV